MAAGKRKLLTPPPPSRPEAGSGGRSGGRPAGCEGIPLGLRRNRANPLRPWVLRCLHTRARSKQMQLPHMRRCTRKRVSLEASLARPLQNPYFHMAAPARRPRAAVHRVRDRPVAATTRRTPLSVSLRPLPRAVQSRRNCRTSSAYRRTTKPRNNAAGTQPRKAQGNSSISLPAKPEILDSVGECLTATEAVPPPQDLALDRVFPTTAGAAGDAPPMNGRPSNCTHPDGDEAALA